MRLFFPVAMCAVVLASCSSSSNNDDSSTAGDLSVVEPEYSTELNLLSGADDGIDLSGKGALLTVTRDSAEWGGISIKTDNSETDRVSLAFSFSSSSIAATENGRGRLTFRANLFNSLADSGVGTGENGNSGDATIRMSVRNQFGGERDVLVCANIINDDGTSTPFVTETEDGDGDGCAGLGWSFDYDTEHTLTIGINRENQTVLLGFDDDIRELASTVAMYDVADGFQSIFVGTPGEGERVQVRLLSLDTGVFVDETFENLQ